MDYNKIKDLANDKKIQLKELIEKIGFTEAGYYQMIRNKSMKIETLEKIAEVLEVDISYFFDYKGNDKENELLKNRIKELEELLTDKREIIDFYKNSIDEVDKYFKSELKKDIPELYENKSVTNIFLMFKDIIKDVSIYGKLNYKLVNYLMGKQEILKELESNKIISKEELKELKEYGKKIDFQDTDKKIILKK